MSASREWDELAPMPKMRQCQIAHCDYSEARGTQAGNFIEGLFICPGHALIPDITRGYILAGETKGKAT